MRRIKLYFLVAFVLCAGLFAWSDYCDQPMQVGTAPSNGERCGTLLGSPCINGNGLTLTWWQRACGGKAPGCTNYRWCGLFFIEWFQSDLCGECTNLQDILVTAVQSVCYDPSQNGAQVACSNWKWTYVDIETHASVLDCHGQSTCIPGQGPAPYRMIVPPGGGNPVPTPLGSTGAQTSVGGRTFHWGTPTYVVPVVVTYD